MRERGIDADRWGNFLKGQRRTIDLKSQPKVPLRSNLTNFDKEFQGSIREMNFIELPAKSTRDHNELEPQTNVVTESIAITTNRDSRSNEQLNPIITPREPEAVRMALRGIESHGEDE